MRYQINNFELLKQMLEQIPDDDSCLVWPRGKAGKEGYGCIRVGPRSIGKMVGAHCEAYRLTYGEIPTGQCVLHKCDNPACFRPSHLFLGTRLENNVDRREKRRSHCPKLTEHDIPKIRECITNGMSQTDVGKRFGVAQSIVSRIVNGKKWHWVP